ncbi:MAG: hypothetical protein QNJ47_05990 [Nostocaceae cyanobacterium]|nr:hypothetical protein [Nostocaceae cyanobacterium]
MTRKITVILAGAMFTFASAALPASAFKANEQTFDNTNNNSIEVQTNKIEDRTGKTLISKKRGERERERWEERERDWERRRGRDWERRRGRDWERRRGRDWERRRGRDWDRSRRRRGGRRLRVWTERNCYYNRRGRRICRISRCQRRWTGRRWKVRCRRINRRYRYR